MYRSVFASGGFLVAAGACLFAAAAFAGAADNSGANPAKAADETKKLVANYGEQVKKDYNTRFGANSPFLPSQAKSESGGFIQIGEFPTAEYCGHCHEDAHKQWRESAHG